MPTTQYTKEAYAEANWFKALGMMPRLAIIRALAVGEKTVAELAALVGIGYPSANSAVVVLERAGLIYTEVAGNSRRCRLVNAVVKKDSVELTSPGGARVVLPL